ncbi:hypothetical protein ABRY23_02805 [Melioribacteraceae bacterium 4301-Me]|uniref:hypothetical protein n=1 Tax=Pyranulibacter aquaticus TaxID=3163344 RepID=UPI003596BE7D
MILEIIENSFYQNAAEFVRELKLENLFKISFNKSIEEWNDKIFISDYEIITTLLKLIPGNYVVDYDDNLDGFNIFRVKI